MKHGFVLLTALLHGGCTLATHAGDSTSAITVADRSKVRVHSMTASHTSLAVGVVSHGCTQASDFSLRIAKETPLTLSVVRLKPDHCRARGRSMTITLGFNTLPKAIQQQLAAGATFLLDNPLRGRPSNMRK